MTDFCFTKLVGQPYRHYNQVTSIRARGTIQSIAATPDHTDDSVNVTITVKRSKLVGKIWRRLSGWSLGEATPHELKIVVELGTCSMYVGKRRVCFVGNQQIVFISLPLTN